jgi:hypothetical protein
MKKILALSLVGLLVFTGCGKKEEINSTETPSMDDSQQVTDPEANVNPGIVDNQTVEEFYFENASLVYDNGTSTLETTVTNVSDTPATLEEFKIIFKDADVNVIVTLSGFVGGSLLAGESKVITSGASMDLTNAASVSYEVVR